MAERVALLVGNNLNTDNDLSAFADSIQTPGVIDGLVVSPTQVTAGRAFVEVTRPGSPDQVFYVLYETDDPVTIAPGNNEYIYVEIDSAKIIDGSANAEDGTGIGEIKTGLTLPTENVALLAETDGVGAIVTTNRQENSLDKSKIKDFGISNAGSNNYEAQISGETAYVDSTTYKIRADVANTGTSTLNINSLGAKPLRKAKNGSFVDLDADDIVLDSIFTATYNATLDIFQFSNDPASVRVFDDPFWGSGEDGDLSGNQTFDAQNKNIVVKNYDSISIGVGETVTISNPATDGTILVLKSKGNVTIDGTIEMSGFGGASGNNGFGILDESDIFGNNGSNGGGLGGGGAGGTGGTAISNNLYTTIKGVLLNSKFLSVGCGSGGGNGGSGGGSSANNGGAGGGAVIILSGGELNFSGTINVNGSNGAAGNNGSGQNGGQGGGGGGGAGMCLIVYDTVNVNTGTINAVGGNGGAGGQGGGSGTGFSGGGGGGGGSSYGFVGATGGTGGASATGQGADGSNSDNGTGAGGGGGNAGEGDGNPVSSGGTAGTTVNSNHSFIADYNDYV